MTLKQLNQETIALIGLGAEHYALLDYLLSKKITAPITVFEKQSKAELQKRFPKIKKWQNVKWEHDTRSIEHLSKFSLILKSPGAHFNSSLRRALNKKSVTLISPMELFMQLSPSQNIIGVTGTKGKGTTASLIYQILKAGRKRVWLGGNIGVAPFSFISKIKKTDWLVLELSSFQLEDMKTSPKIAVLTNFGPEHLKPADPNNPNYHPTLSHYWKSKLKISDAQRKSDLFIVNYKLKSKIKKTAGKLLYFKTSKLPTALPGQHNKENIAAAELAAKAAGTPPKVIATAVKNFKGLEHRLELIGKKKGLTYYNDSFATVPDSTITALASFDQPIILLAGGADKGSNFNKLASLIKRRVKFIVLFKGQGTNRLLTALKKVNWPKKNTVVTDSMSKALRAAEEKATSGDIILLSPACASFGVFKNYKDRGQQFKQGFRLR
jgi:UDP-N-acetylmuramoylalanine--D-glutamate ligase